VRAQVVQVDSTHGKFGVTLKPSLTASADARFLAALFRDLEDAEALGASEGEAVDWARRFAVGAAVGGQVHELRDYGVVCDLDDHEVIPRRTRIRDTSCV
jgi:rRNA biogenesis protein RRP5